ncbi:hypothetical protein [Dongia sp.]|uniref:hypothetical protein n=1 Tax=Dongia sp. TaxID=1977262 RepID=UPI0037527D32
MASQIIALPNELFIAFHRAHWNIAMAIRSPELEMTFIGDSGNEVFVFTTDCRSVGLTSRPSGDPQVVALIIAPDDVDVAQWTWPRPLGHDAVAALIDRLQVVIEDSDDLTAHDRCELGAHLAAARSGPANGLRPIVAAQSFSPWHPKLLLQGQWLSVAHASELANLASKLESYRSRLAAADCEMLIASLSCQAELGLRLRLDARSDGRRDHVARLKTESRRGSLRSCIDGATQLAGATCGALHLYDPYTIYYRPLERVQQLVAIHDEIQPAARRQRTIPRWRIQCWLDDDSSALRERLPVPSSMPVEALPDAAELWLADNDMGRWLGVDHFVRAVLSHLKFCDLSLLQAGNGRVGRLLFGLDLHRSGWPILPWEAAIECNYDLYTASLREALSSGQSHRFLEAMFKILGDAITIGDRMIELVVPERPRLAEALRHPDCLGPEASPEDAWERAEELLGCIFIETIKDEKNGRLLLSDLEELGVLERSSTPVGALFGVPAVRRLFSELPSMLGYPAD